MKSEIDNYISSFPPKTMVLLKQMQDTIKKAAPGAEETIKYAIPTYVLNGKNLVHFAAFKKHIGFYPTPNAIEAFKKKLSVYKGSKGAVQFPIDEPLPLELVRKIVTFRVKENSQRS